MIRNEKELSAAWMSYGIANPPKSQTLDFQKEMVILALITRATGGYSVKIKNISDEPEELLIHIEEQAPGPTCNVTMAFTRNYHVVKLPRIDKKVEFLKHVRIQTCR
ncbi:MAG: protease complex subunit PrcB family protein [Nitrospirae bacterium]|nr:protease complex subunit PrcB family protein [Nitrospirota bacterium]